MNITCTLYIEMAKVPKPTQTHYSHFINGYIHYVYTGINEIKVY